MYSYIKGELTEHNLDHVVVEAGGIGYMIFVSAMGMEQLPSIGSEVKIYTYLYIREDMMVLYGFPEKEELELFKLLISVSGIGPKGAMAVLSTLNLDDLRFAILSGDAKSISKAPGVGGKTAQRVVLELKDKLSLEDAFESKLEKTNHGTAAGTDNSAKNDAIMALTALGYSPAESMKAISKVKITEDMDVEAILREALKSLSMF